MLTEVTKAIVLFIFQSPENGSAELTLRGGNILLSQRKKRNPPRFSLLTPRRGGKIPDEHSHSLRLRVAGITCA